MRTPRIKRDVDERDHRFLTGERTPEGFFRIRNDIEITIALSAEAIGYPATKHQREVSTGYFDLVSNTITQSESSTLALKGSTEEAQFSTATA